ncbi:hypothetical protein GGR58DRAFT_508557 [Xylaria digitata]|nr:hypothetical protein GGR58DRAFT_508557 [Xylaria digitata]
MDNVQVVPNPQPRRPRPALVVSILVSIILAQLYLHYVVPMFSVMPIHYPRADSQNKTADYYDVLKVSRDANSTEIFQGYNDRLSSFNRLSTTSNLKALISIQVQEAEQAYKVLGDFVDRCIYDFVVRNVGIWEYFRCLYNSLYLFHGPQNPEPAALAFSREETHYDSSSELAISELTKGNSSSELAISELAKGNSSSKFAKGNSPFLSPILLL